LFYSCTILKKHFPRNKKNLNFLLNFLIFFLLKKNISMANYNSNFAAQLAPRQPPSYVANYDTNVKQSVFAGTPIPATENDVRILAGQVAALSAMIVPPKNPGTQTQKVIYSAKDKQCHMVDATHMPMPGQPSYENMAQCNAFNH
jgi:hypothetical protein